MLRISGGCLELNKSIRNINKYTPSLEKSGRTLSACHYTPELIARL